MADNENNEIVSVEVFTSVIEMLLDLSQRKMLEQCFNGDAQCQLKK